MIYRDRSLNNHRTRVNSQMILRPLPQRLVFPAKQFKQGYVGKKQFTIKNQDHVILQSPGSSKIVRKDIMNIEDIQGTKPRIKTQAIQNIEKYLRYCNPNQDIRSRLNKRTKTEGEDSLDMLVRSKTDQHQYELRKSSINSSSKTSERNSEIEKYLCQRNIELTKQNILGIYEPQSSNKYATKRPNIANPTYMSKLSIT